MRKLLSPRWLGFHLLTVVFIVVFCVLGHWQWDVGESRRGTLRNTLYGIEWWIFAVILIVLWARLMRQELRTGGQTTTPAEQTEQTPQPNRGTRRRRVPAPVVRPHVDDTEDPELAAYNRYLAALHEQDTSPSDRPPERRGTVSRRGEPAHGSR